MTRHHTAVRALGDNTRLRGLAVRPTIASPMAQYVFTMNRVG
jgi:hypothetical protein